MWTTSTSTTAQHEQWHCVPTQLHPPPWHQYLVGLKSCEEKLCTIKCVTEVEDQYWRDQCRHHQHQCQDPILRCKKSLCCITRVLMYFFCTTSTGMVHKTYVRWWWLSPLVVQQLLSGGGMVPIVAITTDQKGLKMVFILIRLFTPALQYYQTRVIFFCRLYWATVAEGHGLFLRKSKCKIQHNGQRKIGLDILKLHLPSTQVLSHFTLLSNVIWTFCSMPCIARGITIKSLNWKERWALFCVATTLSLANTLHGWSKIVSHVQAITCLTFLQLPKTVLKPTWV